MYKILIRQRDRLHKFLNWEFEDYRDGSLYLVFDRLRKGPRMSWNSRVSDTATIEADEDEQQKFKISYHPCGHVRFHNIGGTPPRSIHCEPIYAITRKYPLAFISIPKVESLDLAEQISEKDAIIDWPEEVVGRVTFWIELGPPTLENPFEPSNRPLLAIGYDPWFALFLSQGVFPAPIPANVPEHAVFRLVPNEDFVTERVSQEQAVIAFHQSRHGVKHQAVTAYRPTDSVYRIVFAVPMYRPPDLTVEFFDPSLSAEVISCTTYDVRFRIKGPGGYVREWVPIRSFILDAEI